jgi:hypothetical protein
MIYTSGTGQVVTIDDSFVAGINPATLPNDPTVLLTIPLTWNGAQLGLLWVMPAVGLSTGTHDHTDNNIHISVVVAGEVTVLRQSTGDTPTVYGALSIIDFAANDPHTITSSQPNTLVLNVTKRGLTIPSIAAAITALTTSANTLTTQVQTLSADLAALPTT